MIISKSKKLANATRFYHMPLHDDSIPRKQRGLVLQGGGALGAYESGVVTVLVSSLIMNIKEMTIKMDHYSILLLVHQ